MLIFVHVATNLSSFLLRIFALRLIQKEPRMFLAFFFSRNSGSSGFFATLNTMPTTSLWCASLSDSAPICYTIISISWQGTSFFVGCSILSAWLAIEAFWAAHFFGIRQIQFFTNLTWSKIAGFPKLFASIFIVASST